MLKIGDIYISMLHWNECRQLLLVKVIKIRPNISLEWLDGSDEIWSGYSIEEFTGNTPRFKKGNRLAMIYGSKKIYDY